MEDHKQILKQNLNINLKYSITSPLPNTVECYVSRNWIRSIASNLKYEKPHLHPFMTPDEVESALQLGKENSDGWQGIFIQILYKDEDDVFSLPKIANYFNPEFANDLSYSQLLNYVSSVNVKNLWKDSYRRFNNHAIIRSWKEEHKTNTEYCYKVLKNALQRLYKCPFIHLNENIPSENGFRDAPNNSMSPIHSAFCIIESNKYFFVFMEPSSYSVWDCANFSSSKLKNNESGALFIVYQLLEAMQAIQDCGLFLGNITLHNLRLDHDFFITVIPHITNSLLKDSEPQHSLASNQKVELPEPHNRNSNSMNSQYSDFRKNINCYMQFLSSPEAKKIIAQPEYIDVVPSCELRMSSLLKLTEKWVVHEISNFDYLLCLNYFSGHSFDSPVFYPFVPWVTDFSLPTGGWRDLTKSKFRLNKGDQQLDHTYELAEADSHHLSHVAHHIPEFFSEVTYYVYKARVTSKAVLKKHVRQQFVASHYPNSIDRMYTLTPEECIPEFYCDSSIFKSIHEDLPDLKVPNWCESVEDFLQKHRSALESNYVSRRLHYWIDLYYGYKLTGSASVKAKNVCLPLVDNHETLLRGGIVQLFNIPHPPKLTPSPFLSKSPPLPFFPDFKNVAEIGEELIEKTVRDDKETGFKQSTPAKLSKCNSQLDMENVNKIELPVNYNPLTALNQIEMLHNFFWKTSGKLPNEVNPNLNYINSVKQAAHLQRVRDMQTVGCLIVQMLCPIACRLVNPKDNLAEAYSLALKLLQEPNEIPMALQRALNVIFEIDNYSKDATDRLPSQFSAISDSGLPPPSPHQLLQPLFNIISFPPYFSRLSSFARNFKAYLKTLEECLINNSDIEDIFIENHIKKTVKVLTDLLPSLSPDMMKIIFPYVIEVYKNSLSSACAALYLTDIVFQAFEPDDCDKHIRPLIVKLFEAEAVTSNHHIALFHRNFLIQLIVRLKLKTFLKYFVTPIIEGAGGYKNPALGSKMGPSFNALDNSMLFRKDDFSFENEESGQTFSDESTEQTFRSNSTDFFHPEYSSFNSPVEGHMDVTDLDNDPEIFVFEGGEDDDNDDTLNDFSETPTFDLNESVKSPFSDTGSLDSPRLRKGSIPSLGPSPHSPSASDVEDQTSSESTLEIITSKPITPDSSNTISIPKSKYLNISPGSDLYSTSLPDKPIYITKSDNLWKNNNIDQMAKVASLSSSVQVNIASPLVYNSDISLPEMCCENVVWLSNRLGPVLTARHSSRNILRMLSLCYLPQNEEALRQVPFQSSRMFSVTRKTIAGDINAENIIQCLIEIADLYGEQFILLQYICHITELVNWCGSKLTISQEAGLIGAMTLLQYLLAKLSDTTFMECLQETLIRNAVYPVIRLLSSLKVYFPNGSSVRRVLAWRVVDSLYIMVQRVGPEMSKEKLMPAITRFFTAFDKVCSFKRNSSEVSLIPDDCGKESMHKSEYSQQENRDKIKQQLKDVFVPELAYLSYIPLCKFLSTKYMEQTLPNHCLIRSMCLQFDENNQSDLAAALTLENQCAANSELGPKAADSKFSGKTNVAVTGNRIDIKDLSDECFFAAVGDLSASSEIETNFTSWKSSENKNMDNLRHIKGNWLAYWEHEIGRRETEEGFNFKQIQLQSFVGHSNSVKSLCVLDNENSFISCSKDKTVKIWSIKSQGDGSAECGAEWTYTHHKKSVFDVTFNEALRVVASCDSTVHIWDPFTGTCLKQLDSLKHSPVTVLGSVSAPSTQLISATTDSTLKFIDLRMLSYTNEWKISTNSVGLVRCIATSRDANLVAVAHSSGVVATLDLRMGQLLSTWKPHEGEVLSLQWYKKGTFISSALDQTICVWSVHDTKFKFHLKGPTEPVHLLKIYDDEVLTGTTANRIGVHTSVSPRADFSCTKLRANTFKGVLTSMAILPLNRQLLLGADNGCIRLLC